MIAVFKRDFKAFFTSPIGYVLIGLFLFLMNLFFKFYNLDYAYSDLTSLFSLMMTVLMILVPFITMKLFAEEYKLKTDQLLLTAPVSVMSIVTGKFLAAYALFCTALSGTLLWVVVVAVYGELNVPAIVGCYVAILFAAATFIAIGLFLSSLTENQIIAAFSTFGVFFAINLLGSAADLISVSWLQAVVRWCSIFSRFDNFSKGMFAVADIVYYLVVTLLFLFLTSRVLEKKRWSN